MDEKIEVIGVDVGNGYTKTVSTQFVSGVKALGSVKPVMMTNVVEYEGKFYIVGGERLKHTTDNKNTKDFLILCLAGIGEELKARNITDTKIILSEGLPPERCNRDTIAADKKYYCCGQTIEFSYEDEPHVIEIVDVLVNPQCVSAVVDKMGDLPDPCVLVDVGTYTVDVLPIIDGKPQGSMMVSLFNGVRDCMEECKADLRRRIGKEVTENQIQKVMRGFKDTVSPEYSAIIQTVTRNYVENIAATLEEHKINLDTITCVFMGGGASVIKEYGMGLFPLAMYVPNIRANAVGYEKIGKSRLSLKTSA